MLVVDDDLDLLETLREWLFLRGYEVATARDGLEALEQIRRRRPDAILSDQEMPRCSGEALHRLLLEQPEATPRFYLMSGAAGVAEQAARMGVRFLPKPIDLATLDRVLPLAC